jgi:hypothetical protein
VRSITREQRLYIIAGACVIYIISLFFNWFSVSGANVDFSAQDVVPTWWLLLIFAVVAAGIALAEAQHFELPPVVRPASWVAALTVFVFLVTLMFFLDPAGGVDRAFGLFIAVLFSLIAAAVAVMHWREEER